MRMFRRESFAKSEALLKSWARDSMALPPEAVVGKGALQAPGGARGFAWRMLPRLRVVGGKRYQLHATRGWKCIGRAA